MGLGVRTKDFGRSEDLTSVRRAIVAFLRGCDLYYPTVEIDQNFTLQCCEQATAKGYPMEGKQSLRPFIPGGVAMAATAYSHLPELSTRIWIALYTAFLIYTDDVFERDVSQVDTFNDRFVKREPQEDPVLDGFADLLRETADHWSPLVSNMIVASTLNLVSALLLEYETRGMEISSSAENYPTFTRVLCGASEAYGLFAFPRSVPLSHYIQALPEQMKYINNGNDILSFYKEELAGETVNRVSLLAACRHITKRSVLDDMVADTIQSHKRILAILAHHEEAYEAYTAFSQGYIGFHAGLRRYKLDELELTKVAQLSSSHGRQTRAGFYVPLLCATVLIGLISFL